jgi:sortase A
VLPTETGVIAPTSDNRLTMTACHPKHSAKQRIIVQSRLVSEPAPAPPLTPKVAQLQRTEIRKDANSLGGDASAKWPALVFALGLVVAWFLAWLIGTRWRKWTTYIIFSPLFAAMLWGCFLFTDRWLPSF